MNNSIKIFAVSMLFLVPGSLNAQVKNAENTKNIDTTEILQVTPCATSAEAVSPVKGVGVVIKKGSSQSERAMPSAQNNALNPNVTTSDALKTRTKSNQTNERTEQNKCTEPDFIDANKPVVFKFRSMSKANPNFVLKIFQLKDDQNYSGGVVAEKIIFEKTLSNVEEFSLDKLITSVQQPYKTNFVWQIQAVDNRGNGIGDKQYGWIKASFDKGEIK